MGDSADALNRAFRHGFEAGLRGVFKLPSRIANTEAMRTAYTEGHASAQSMSSGARAKALKEIEVEKTQLANASFKRGYEDGLKNVFRPPPSSSNVEHVEYVAGHADARRKLKRDIDALKKIRKKIRAMDLATFLESAIGIPISVQQREAINAASKKEETTKMPNEEPKIRRWLPPEERYQNDNHFHSIVDMLESQMHAAEFTASELREAATLAAIHYEMRNTRRVYVTASGLAYEPAKYTDNYHERMRALNAILESSIEDFHDPRPFQPKFVVGIDFDMTGATGATSHLVVARVRAGEPPVIVHTEPLEPGTTQNDLWEYLSAFRQRVDAPNNKRSYR